MRHRRRLRRTGVVQEDRRRDARVLGARRLVDVLVGSPVRGRRGRPVRRLAGDRRLGASGGAEGNGDSRAAPPRHWGAWYRNRTGPVRHRARQRRAFRSRAARSARPAPDVAGVPRSPFESAGFAVGAGTRRRRVPSPVDGRRAVVSRAGDARRRAVRPSVRRGFGPADGQGATGPRRGGRREETAGTRGAGKRSSAQGEDGGDRRRVLRNRSDRLLSATAAACGDAGGSSRPAGEQGRVHAARSASGQRQSRRRGEQGQNRASAPVPGGGRSGGNYRGDACLPVSAEGVWGTVGPCERMGLRVAVEGLAARGGREGRDQRRARIRLPVHSPRYPMAR